MVRAFIDRRAQRGGTAKVIVMLFFNEAVVALQRIEKSMVIHPQFFRQLARRAGAGDETFGDVLVGGFVFRPHVLVKDDIREVLRQRDNRGGDLIAGLHFVEEAVSLRVHQNRPAAANRFGNQIRGLLFDGRVDLDFAHIHGARADAFKQRDTAAGGPFMVGGHKTRQIRAVFHHHRAVGAEAAGGHHNALRLYHSGFVFIGEQAHAADLIAAHQDLFHRRIQQDIDTALSIMPRRASHSMASGAFSTKRRSSCGSFLFLPPFSVSW